MTYNFDADRWYANERAALKAQFEAGRWSREAYEKKLEALEQRYERMVERLDGTYRLP